MTQQCVHSSNLNHGATIITDCIWLKTVNSYERSLTVCCATKLTCLTTEQITVMSGLQCLKRCWSRGCKHGGWGVSPVFPSTVPTPTHHTCFLSPHRCQVAQKLNKMFLTNTTPTCSAQWVEILAALV